MIPIPANYRARDVARLVAATAATTAASPPARLESAAWSADRIDCGSPHPFGICPKCHRGHGFVVFKQKEERHG